MSGLLPLLATRPSTLPQCKWAFAGALDRCDSFDLLPGSSGLRLLAVTWSDQVELVLEVKSCDPVTGCPGCEAIATGHGKIVTSMIDAP